MGTGPPKHLASGPSSYAILSHAERGSKLLVNGRVGGTGPVCPLAPDRPLEEVATVRTVIDFVSCPAA